MAKETRIQTSMPGPKDPGERVDQIWTVLTHEGDGEFWSEVLDGAKHPCTEQDRFGFDTVRKFFGDTLEESRDAALAALREIVLERGGEARGEVEG